MSFETDRPPAPSMLRMQGSAVQAFKEMAPHYWLAGWKGVLPIRNKKPCIAGYHGADGLWPEYLLVLSWAAKYKGANIALRLPPGMIGIDIDCYGGKRGGPTLDTLSARHGPLPPTYCTTSRDDGSGIYLYLVPEGSGGDLSDPGNGSGIEVIRTNNRYAVVWPSRHGREGNPAYVWRYGQPGAANPAPGKFPARADITAVLPMAWYRGLHCRRPGERSEPGQGGRSGSVVGGAGVGAQWLLALPGGAEPMSLEMKVTLAVAEAGVRAGSRHGGCHPAMLRGVLALVREARRGTPGGYKAVKRLHEVYLTVREEDGRKTPAEAQTGFAQAVAGAIAIVERQARND